MTLLENVEGSSRKDICPYRRAPGYRIDGNFVPSVTVHRSLKDRYVLNLCFIEVVNPPVEEGMTFIAQGSERDHVDIAWRDNLAHIENESSLRKGGPTITNHGQDHVETETVNQDPSAEDQSLEPVASEEPISDEEVAVVDTEEAEKSILATQGIDADEAPISKVDAEEDHQQLPTAPVARDLVLSAVQNTPVVRSTRKPVKRQAAIPADQQFLLDMNAVDTDIRQLKQALAEKLREQNSQLQSLIDRY